MSPAPPAIAPRIALVGDYSAGVPAHVAIPRALTLARAALPVGPEGAAVDLSWTWFATESLAPTSTATTSAAALLAPFAAVWLVPASPYRSLAGALAAVRFARESRLPFLGTCGGFQHALLELALHVCGHTGADHAETNPAAPTADLVVTRLACDLVEARRDVTFTPGSLLHAACGPLSSDEGYRCRFGPSAAWRPRLEGEAGLRFTGFDAATDEPRAAELPREQHPFFVGTLFQPERAALTDPPRLHPIIAAFVRATVAAAGRAKEGEEEEEAEDEEKEKRGYTEATES